MNDVAIRQESSYHVFQYAGYHLVIEGYGRVLWYADDKYLGDLDYPKDILDVEKIKENIKSK